MVIRLPADQPLGGLRIGARHSWQRAIVLRREGTPMPVAIAYRAVLLQQRREARRPGGGEKAPHAVASFEGAGAAGTRAAVRLTRLERRSTFWAREARRPRHVRPFRS